MVIFTILWYTCSGEYIEGEIMVAKRFVDRKDKRDLIKNSPDFHLRKRSVSLIIVAFLFVVVLSGTFILLSNLISVLLFLPPNQPPPDDLIQSILFTIIFSAVMVAVFSVYLIHRIRQTVTEVEFQNLIFASSMRVNSDFCLIVHKEKKGIYCDFNFGDVFPAYEHGLHDPFHHLMESGGFKAADENNLLKALEKGGAAEFDFTLKKGRAKPKKIHITLDPIERPQGFYILRGYLKKK